MQHPKFVKMMMFAEVECSHSFARI